MKVFFRIDLLEVPYDDFLRNLEVGLLPSMVSFLELGLELGLVWESEATTGVKLLFLQGFEEKIEGFEILRG